MVDVTLHLDGEQADRLERLCRQTGLDASSAVIDALAFYEESLGYDPDRSLSPEDMASVERGAADIAAGRLTDHETLFARLSEKHGG
jgi:predicted transcriptional regulator